MDDWDADDFEVPTLPGDNTKPTANKVEDEDEDLALKETEVVKSAPSAAVLAAQEKKAKEQEKILAAKAQFATFEDETADQKKLREKQQLEESEAALANEMLGGKTTKDVSGDSLAKGLGSVALKTKDDHVKYGNITRNKLGNSSAFNIAAFYKSLSKILDNPSISAEAMDEIIADLTAIREKKAKAAAKQNTQKKSKKEIEKQRKEHADKWGDSELPDEYVHAEKYASLEDDFM